MEKTISRLAAGREHLVHGRSREILEDVVHDVVLEVLKELMEEGVAPTGLEPVTLPVINQDALPAELQGVDEELHEGSEEE